MLFSNVAIVMFTLLNKKWKKINAFNDRNRGREKK
jgi:hypothetical protein